MVRRVRFFRGERSSVLVARVQDRPWKPIGRRPKERVSREIVPDETVPGEIVPQETVPGVRVPEAEVPRVGVLRMRAV
jgi:hypothetical protein